MKHATILLVLAIIALAIIMGCSEEAPFAPTQSQPVQKLEVSAQAIPTTINLGQYVGLDGEVKGGQAPYNSEWYLPDSMTVGYEQNVNFRPDSVGKYTMYFLVIDADGDEDSAQVSFSVVPEDSVIITEYDTLTVIVMDTVIVATPPDTIIVIDSIPYPVMDTLILIEIDTVIVYDTTWMYVYDTTVQTIVIHDTVIVVVIDSVPFPMVDTVFQTVYVTDTLWHYDTTVVIQTEYDTIYVPIQDLAHYEQAGWILEWEKWSDTVQLHNPSTQNVNIVFNRRTLGAKPDSVEAIIRILGTNEEKFFSVYGDKDELIFIGPLDVPENVKIVIEFTAPYYGSPRSSGGPLALCHDYLKGQDFFFLKNTSIDFD